LPCALQGITEAVAVTHFEDNKKSLEEKDKKIDDLLNVSAVYVAQVWGMGVGGCW